MGERRDLNDGRLTQARAMLGASILLCALVVPISLAGAVGDSGDREATASAGVKKKKFKKLKRRVKALEQEQGGSRRPKGSAGGDLAGTYPNPAIAGGAVTSAKLGTGAVSGSKLANGAVSGAKLADGAVSGDKLANGAVSGAKVLNGTLGTAELSSTIPAARVSRTVDQSVPFNTETPVAFTVERYDTANMHNSGLLGNSSHLTAPVDGIYAINAELHWDSTSNIGNHAFWLVRNGTTKIARDLVPADFLYTSVGTQAKLQAGDFVQVVAAQTGDTDVSVDKSDEESPEFSMTWLAPGP